MERRHIHLSAVGVHLLLTVLHDVVHAAIPVSPVGWNVMVAAGVLYLIPVLWTELVVSGYRRVGAMVFLSAGLGGFASSDRRSVSESELPV